MLKESMKLNWNFQTKRGKDIFWKKKLMSCQSSGGHFQITRTIQKLTHILNALTTAIEIVAAAVDNCCSIKF